MRRIILALVLNAIAIPASASIDSVPSFSGDLSESFESFNNFIEGPLFLESPAILFNGNGQIEHPLLSIYQPGVAVFGLGGNGTAGVYDGVKGLGINTPPNDPSTHIATIVMDDPVIQFGGYWAVALDPIGPPNKINFEFFDRDDASLGTFLLEYDAAALQGDLQWQGWLFDRGVKRITIQGYAPIVDGLQAILAPPPSPVVNDYLGSIENATGFLASLTPPGTEFSGAISIVPTPSGTSTNTDDLTEALFKMIEVTSGSTLFCFNYIDDCEADELSVPITEIMPFKLSFGASGCPTSGTIELRAFSPTFSEEILITLDLFARTFLVEGNTLGTATGTGGLDCSDSDNDGIDDSMDNCTLIANPDQRDTNGDGYGNVCDPDLDDNGIVNFGDIALWVPFFNTATSGDADFNGDGSANFGDYALFLNYFLQLPGPSGVVP